MSIVAISQTLGSLGEEIGRELARALSYAFADREMIWKAAEQLDEAVMDVEDVAEETPSLWERLSETKRRYLSHVEAIIWELAARDNVVLVGRGASFILHDVRHAVRVRVTAPQHLRTRRLESERGLISDAAELVRQSDRERGARIKFFYDAIWEDSHRYDLVLNTEHLDVPGAVRLIGAALQLERFHPTAESLRTVRDRSVSAHVEAALLRLRAGDRLLDSPRLLAIVRRGALEQFRLLQEVCANEPVRVMWDRRMGERRRHLQPPAIERRRQERRGRPPASWETVSCVIVLESRGPRVDSPFVSG